MAWYKTGTVGVTNGATAVTLSGGDALANIFVGDTFKGPDGKDYEVASITSAAGFTLAQPYQGVTATGQSYAIQPTANSGALRLLLAQVSDLVTNYQGSRDAWAASASGTLKGRKSEGAGLVEDLSPADVLAMLTGGSDAAALTGAEVVPALQGDGGVKVTVLDLVRGVLALAGQNFGVGTPSPSVALDISSAGYGQQGRLHRSVNTNSTAAGLLYLSGNDSFGNVTDYASINALINSSANGNESGSLYFSTMSGGLLVTRGGFDSGGNFLVGTAAGTYHRTAKAVNQGSTISDTFSSTTGVATMIVYGVSAISASSQAAGVWVGNNTTTGRSINAGGTINASGADYAEYVLKADGCGTIQPGHICGVNADGLLTDRWDAAHTFVIKSTDPAYVGNDTWAQALGPRPEQPALALPEYAGPERPAEDDPDYAAKLAGWAAAQEMHATAVAAAEADHAAAMQAYQQELADFEARLEAERQKVDRIAFSGQVPVNVQGAQPGQYIDAAPGPDGSIIGAPSETPGPRTVGKVWKILPDGRAWVAVRIG